jgi:hypothetical protein
MSNTTTTKKVQININRKLMSHDIVQQLRDTINAEGMLAGSAVLNLLDEYDRLRYLSEGLATAYMKQKPHDIKKIMEILQLIL